MPALADVRVIDTDTHLTEPHDLWTSRAPRGFEERVPHIVEVNGQKSWAVDDQVLGLTVSDGDAIGVASAATRVDEPAVDDARLRRQLQRAAVLDGAVDCRVVQER